MSKTHEYELIKKFDSNVIFFPKTLNYYLIDDDVYKDLEKYNNDGIFEFLDSDIKKLLEENSSEDYFKNYLKERTVSKYISINLNVAQTCNMKCIYCYGDEGTYGNESLMTFETAKKTLDFYSENNYIVISICFFGGEPLMNFDLIQKIVNYVETKKINAKFSIITNGTLITEKIAKFFKEKNISVMLSMDSTDEKLNSKLRQTKNGEDINKLFKKNLEILKKNKINYSIRGTLTKFNAKKNILENMNYHYGSSIYSFKQISDKNKEELIPSNEIFENIIEDFIEDFLLNKDIKKMPESINAVIKVLKEKKQKKLYCSAGSSMITISSNGDIHMCHRMAGTDIFKIGNIYNISNNEYIKVIESKIKKYLNYDNYLEAECNKCWIRNFCFGGCFQEQEASKNFNKKNKKTFCDKYKISLRLTVAMIATLYKENNQKIPEKI